MKLKKGNVIKDIQDNLVSIYLNMGWEVTKEDKKEDKSQPSQSSILNQSSGNK